MTPTPFTALADPEIRVEFREHLEQLLIAIASEDLPDRPYVVFESDLDERYRTTKINGCTGNDLDLLFEEHLRGRGAWRGRAPVVVLADNNIALGYAKLIESDAQLSYALAEFAQKAGMVAAWPLIIQFQLRHTAIHELAHIVADGFGPRRLSSPEVVAEVARSMQQTVAGEFGPEYECLRFSGHGWSFIRTALHLVHRARKRQCELNADLICAGQRYGLSRASDYADALGDEPERFTGKRLSSLNQMRPPESFVRVWANDLTAALDIADPAKIAALPLGFLGRYLVPSEPQPAPLAIAANQPAEPVTKQPAPAPCSRTRFCPGALRRLARRILSPFFNRTTLEATP